MKTKKILSFMLAIVMVVSMMATLGITASAARTDATPVYVGETYDRVAFVSSVTTFSAEEQDGNIWYFYTTDETKLKVVNWYIEEDAVEGDKLHVFLKGIAVGNGLEILCKQYDAESTSWVDGVSAINGIYNVVPAPVYLDLDENTTDIKDSKDLDQNYNLTVTEMPSASGAVTKVKLSWEIKDINAARMDNKVWDADELQWVVASSNTIIMDNGTAKFTLENYSSVKVNATASFKAEGDFKGTASYDVEGGKVTLDTANGNSTYSKTNVPKAVINATITTAADDFKNLAATTKSTKYGTYTVTISTYVETESIVLSNDTLDLNTNTNKTATLTATVSPANATDNKVTWSSDNTAVATVDENGKVTAVGSGTAIITATVGAKSTTCTVNVVAKIPVTNVSLNITKLTLTSNDPSNNTATLIATVTPENATDKNVTWSSSNTAVAIVDASGNVTAVEYAHGKVDIKATADDVCATCTVTVNCKPE